KAFCEYCQVATVCSIASIVLAVPEVMTAVLRR
ncbi:MAG TPA: vitamin K epoxide reductase, partial [Candidatus Sericytochromatia bacterium]